MTTTRNYKGEIAEGGAEGGAAGDGNGLFGVKRYIVYVYYKLYGRGESVLAEKKRTSTRVLFRS